MAGCEGSTCQYCGFDSVGEGAGSGAGEDFWDGEGVGEVQL
jgi:hypothetical protein